MLARLVCLALSLSFAKAEAQVDPSSALLLRGGSTPEIQDGGRYTIRPTEGNTTEPKKPASSLKPAVVAPAPTQPAQAPAAPVVNEVIVGPEVPPPTLGVGEKVRNMVLGGSLDQVESYREQVHEEDPRKNLLDIEIGPTLIYLDSTSNYWYRSYSFSAPGFIIGARVWVSPFFGIRTNLINSMGGSVYSNVDTRDRAEVNASWLEAGLVWRRYLGVSRKASSFSVGLDYLENQIQPVTSAVNRMRVKSSGFRVSIEATLPSSTSFAWQLGGAVAPNLDHTERTSGTKVTSGSRDQTAQIGVWFGGLHTMDRSNQIYWKFDHTFERTHFDGQASVADPSNGATPKGVSVTTGTSMFILGYRWGN